MHFVKTIKAELHAGIQYKIYWKVTVLLEYILALLSSCRDIPYTSSYL